jgi:PAS domain S-box-containing protein
MRGSTVGASRQRGPTLPVNKNRTMIRNRRHWGRASARHAQADMPEPVVRLIGRLFFGTGVAAGLFSALLVAVLPDLIPPASRLALVGGYAGFGLLCAFAYSRSSERDVQLGPLLFAVSALTIALVTASSVLLSLGLRNPAIGFFGLLVCVLGAVTTRRLGVTLAALSLAAVAALAVAEVLAGAGAPTARALPWLLLAFHGLVIGSGLAGGMLIARVLEHYLLAAAEREQRFRGLLGIAADWYWELDDQFRFTHISDSRAGGSGSSPTHALGSTPWDHGALGLNDEQADANRADLESHRPFANLLARRVDARGQTRYLNLSGEPRFDTDGVFLGYWGVGRDVTAELRAQQAVASSEMRYRELFTRSPSPLLLHRRGMVIDANQAAASMFGYRDALAIRGASLVEHFPVGEHRAQARERIARAEQLRVGEALPVSDVVMHALDGRILHVQATGVGVDTSSGPAALAIYFDITARKATEAALRRSETLLSHLFATSPDCMTLTELDSGRYTLVNDRFLDIFGFRREEVIGRTSDELNTWNDPADRQRVVEAIRRQGGVQDVAMTMRRRDGGRVPMLVSAAQFGFEGQRLIVLTARDVTGSEQSRLEVEAILNTVSLAIAFVRGQRVVRINARHRQMFGWSEQELNQVSLAALWHDPADYQALRRNAVAKLRHRQGYECEAQMRRRDGSLMWCRLQAQPVDPNDPIGGGTIWSAEDITERRQTQQALAAARDAAEAASRAKSAFLANTSHEIRTPLNGLLGLARLAMQPDLAQARRQQYLNQIFDSTQSLAGIISDILDLSKIEAGKITLEDLPFGLRDTLAAVHHAYLSLAEVKGLTLTLDIAEAVPPTVRGDPLRVRQILSNYVTNALKFTERGSVRIEASVRDGSVLLAVHDTGPGIDAATQLRLFTPFSQADESVTRRYGGTGLGLSICRELAQLMGGEVGVDSEPGRGSVFWAELPLRASAPADAIDDPAPDEDELLSGARVLMVEDNPVNMLIAVAMLEQWGVLVAQAADGAMAVEAVGRAADAGEPFDLVLMDVHMPVMSGHAAVRQLRERFDAQALPVIALTAAALVSERDEALGAGMNDFLTKPIDARKLRSTLARCLRPTAEA